MRARIVLALLALLALLACAATAAAQQQPDLKTEIAAADAAMFGAYNAHDAAKLMTYFSEDLEFYHDKDGLLTFPAVRDGFAKLLSRGDGLHRDLVGSLEIYPAGKDRAMEIGAHRFCHVENGKDDCGTFGFAMVWQKTDDRWRVTRVLSYGH